MDHSLQLRPTLNQSLVLSPQLQQSLALLQAPMLELKALVEKELEQNPVLEELQPAEVERQRQVEAGAGGPASDLDPTEPPKDMVFDPATDRSGDKPVDDFQAEFERLVQMDQEWRDHFAQTNLPMRFSAEAEEKRQFLFDSLTAGTSLQESLLEQARESDLPENLLPIAKLLVGNIDDCGYFKPWFAETTKIEVRRKGEPRSKEPEVHYFDPHGPAQEYASSRWPEREYEVDIEALIRYFESQEAAEQYAKREHWSEGKYQIKSSIDDLTESTGVPAATILQALKIIQTFDPPGVGARDLRECLLLQLDRAGQRESAEYRIIADHLPALARRRVPELAAALGLSAEAVQAAMARIARLDPRPGSQFLPDTEQYVVPEVFVRKAGDEFVVTTNNDELPRLRVSNAYKDLMARSAVDVGELQTGFARADPAVSALAAEAVAAIKRGDHAKALLDLRRLGADPLLTDAQAKVVPKAIQAVTERQGFLETRAYIREKINAAKFLIRSIEQRQHTLLRIAQEIVRRQREFMEEGPTALKPLTMAQVGEVVGVHETTVSRAVSRKYMQTPRGVFEMRYFFTTGLQTSSGQDVSNTSVKETLAEIFRAEDAKAPLADDTVADMLKEKGVRIARRTVAKYRAELGILPSTLRKVY